MLKSTRTWGLLLVVVIVTVTGGRTLTPRALAQNGGYWAVVRPGGETICSDGSPYQFYVHNGALDKLLIFFQGGGACWDAATCFRLRLYDPDIGPADNPAASGAGVLDLDAPDNPFRDYSMVFIPYCTGDVHTGSSLTFYDVDGARRPVHHTGYRNAQAALAWTFAQFPDAAMVFNMGCSAGSLGSIFHAATILEQYPEASVAHLGDAAGGYRGAVGELIASWGTSDGLPRWVDGVADLAPADLTFAALYTLTAAHYPAATFAQVNTAGDLVQNTYLVLMDDALPYAQGLAANLAEIRAAVPNFRAYTAWGVGHCLTNTPNFYTYQVDGVRLRDWVAALAAGEPVADVQCTNCDAVELYRE